MIVKTGDFLRWWTAPTRPGFDYMFDAAAAAWNAAAPPPPEVGESVVQFHCQIRRAAGEAWVTWMVFDNQEAAEQWLGKRPKRLDCRLRRVRITTAGETIRELQGERK